MTALQHTSRLPETIRRRMRALERVVSVLDLRRAIEQPSRAVDVALALAFAGALEEATRWIHRLDAANLNTTDTARLAAGRSLVHLMRGELPACETALGQAMGSGVSDPAVEGASSIAVLARLFQEDPAGARAAHDAAVQAGSANLAFEEVMLTSVLAWTAGVEGNLREADHLADVTLERAARYGALDHPMTSGALFARGRVRYERAHFEPAEECFDRMLRLSERCRPAIELLGLVSLARLCITEGRLVEAAAALERARSLPSGTRSPLMDFVTACSVHLALATGDPGRASELATTLQPSQRRTRLEASIALAGGNAMAALDALNTLQPDTYRQRLDGSVLRARALDALHTLDADETLRATVNLAREEGVVIALTDDMPELSANVSSLLRSRPMDAFDQTVLDRLDQPRVRADIDLTNADGLTTREQTILRYLDSRLTIREIASECYVSPNTVKSQSQAVYRKLGVSSRREAVAEGRKLRLI
jgi:ATP/maltotriose-dependent transcriptional regulator MalT